MDEKHHATLLTDLKINDTFSLVDIGSFIFNKTVRVSYLKLHAILIQELNNIIPNA